MSFEMHSKRVLIVDDEPHLAILLADGLETTLGNEYIIETAGNGDEALAKLKQTTYALLITDYMMPGTTGLELARAARQVSPDTQVVLMTAYGNDSLRDMVGNLNLDGYLDKPFALTEIQEIVERAIEHTKSQNGQAPYHSGKRVPDESSINEQLKSLQVDTNARCVLLLSSSGYLINAVGQTKGLDISGVSALVAANFIASSELANLLGSNSSIFKSSYHEGNDYNIYSYDVNGELLLVVIFGMEGKPGVVWFYTKQTAAELAPLLANQSAKFAFSDEDVTTVLDAELDGLFGEEINSDEGASLPDETKAAGHHELKAKEIREREESKPMSFEQAVAAGLVPPQIVQRERNHK